MICELQYEKSWHGLRTELTQSNLGIFGLYMYKRHDKRLGMTAEDMLHVTEDQINDMTIKQVTDMMAYNECATQYYENISPDPKAVSFLETQFQVLAVQYDRMRIIKELSIC